MTGSSPTPIYTFFYFSLNPGSNSETLLTLLILRGGGFCILAVSIIRNQSSSIFSLATLSSHTSESVLPGPCL
jgi:hypothetical protein